MDTSLPIRHKNHGGECILRGLADKHMNWHPRFGFYNNKVDINCVNQLFDKKTKNIVFFGGSIMFNGEAPNYLTSIEYYAFQEMINNFRSINLAVSGSRLSNELSKFIEYIPKIKNIDLIVFLDGVNELHSIKFNGRPDDDYYWTAGVNYRIHKPLSFLVDSLLDRSKIFEILAINVLNYKSSRIARNYKVTNELIEQSVADYFYRKKIIKILCKDLKIKCVFALHPVFDTTDNLNSGNDKLIAKYIQLHFPNNNKIINYGYNLIKEDKDVIDLSKIYNGMQNIFFDEAHTNKFGSETLGKELFKIIRNEIEIEN